MIKRRFSNLLALLVLVPSLASCNFAGLSFPSFRSQSDVTGGLALATPLPPLLETMVTFRVEVPSNTSPSETVYLSLLDEVTGLALNAKYYAMQAAEPAAGAPADVPRVYTLTLPFSLGSVIQYRYERQMGSIRVLEHLSDGSPVRYRLFYVQAPGEVSDVVSRWTDTSFEGETGQVIGQATDAETNQPVPGLLVAAGGAQTLTNSDGTFILEGLPVGTHNLVIYALDGSFHTFQQGARLAASSTTPVPTRLSRAGTVKAVFVVRLPENTPPVIPLRLGGNLLQLGNTFASLSGGMSSLALNMPVLSILPDGRYSITLSLPIGADLRYKYTLGDGFWNAEHLSSGEFRLRQIIVPDYNILVEDVVETWFAGSTATVTFDVSVPSYTPPSDFVSIQFNPLFGWTEPIPMWRLGENRWAYILYSPLNLPGNFNYRYCRNNQCGVADDGETMGLHGIGRPLIMGQEPKTVKDQVAGWAYLSPAEESFTPPSSQVIPRDATFWAGIEFTTSYHPAWKALFPGAIDRVQSLGANWLVLSPTWSYGRSAPGNNPPVLVPVMDADALWPDLAFMIEQGHSRTLNVALFPRPNFLIKSSEWWETATRDPNWWAIWFDQYRTFILHHADMAARNNAGALILGGAWLLPALPDSYLSSGISSGVPADAEARWRGLLADVRTHFSGKVLWGLPASEIDNPPPFLDDIDMVYLLYTGAAAQSAVLSSEFPAWVDNSVQPFHTQWNKPVILAFAFPSNPDLPTQYNAYAIAMETVNSRAWLAGFTSRGYYPPSTVQDYSISINGKTASDLVGYWFTSWLNAVLP